MNNPKLNQSDVKTITTKPIIETQCTSCSKYPLKNHTIYFKEVVGMITADVQKIRELALKGYTVIQIAEQMKLYPQEVTLMADVHKIKIKYYND